MGEQNLITQKRLQINAGMSVNYVKSNGSTGQQLAANLFDRNKDGKFNENEASLFNNCHFTVTNNRLTIYEQNGSEEKVTEIRYKDKKELESLTQQSSLTVFNWGNKSKKQVSGAEIYVDYKRLDIDLVNNNVSINGAKESFLSDGIYTYGGINLNARNSDIKKIQMEGGKLTLNNVENKSWFGKSTSTKLYLKDSAEIDESKTKNSKYYDALED